MKDDIPEEEYFCSGHSACQGCGPAIGMQLITRAAGENTIVAIGTGCMEVISTPYPKTAWKLPCIHNAFENPAPTASGIRAALDEKGEEDTNVLVIAGDGSTYDIGFGGLSGMLERGEDITYVCYNNQSYANTGMQRSSATPFGSWTTTTPVGKETRGKRNFRKPLTKIVAAHEIPYVASATIAYPEDLYKKVKKGLETDGPAFINILAPCVLGFKTKSMDTYKVSKLAVETGAWTLYEVEEGNFKLNKKPKELKPIENYLKLQGRFKDMSKEDVKKLQEHVNEEWGELVDYEEEKVTF